MSDLRALQHEFLAYLLNGDPAIAEHLADSDTSQASGGRDRRLGVYAHAYRQRLRETLETDHEILGLYLGDALWDQLADGYIAAHPSRYRSLRQYGDALPAWLRDQAPFASHPQIAELAAFERRLLASFDAADAARTDPAALTALPAERWPTLQVRFHPSLQLFSAATNCVPIWQALKAKTTPPAPEAAATTWLLWRGADRLTEFRSMPADEARMLRCLIEGGRFADACECLSEQIDPTEVAATALRFLTGWLQDGLVRSIAAANQAPLASC